MYQQVLSPKMSCSIIMGEWGNAVETLYKEWDNFKMAAYNYVAKVMSTQKM